MDDAVVEFCEFGSVPTVGGAYEVSRDALQTVEVGAVAVGTFVDVVGRFVAAVHTTYAGVVDASVADVQGIHHVHDVHHGFGVVGCVAVYLDVEDVAAACELVVRSLDFSLVSGGAFVVDGHVVRVGIVLAVGDAWELAKFFLVAACEASAEAFGGCGEHAVVVLVLLAEVVDAVAHVGDDAQSEFLRLGALSMVFAGECYETFGQSDEANAEGALVDDAFDGVVGVEFFASDPEAVHEQGELLGKGGLLELKALMQLTCSKFEQIVELGEEGGYALLFVLDIHTLDGQFHDVDGGEADVAASYAGFGSEPVLEDACATAHGGYFVEVALRVVGTPVGILIVGGVEVEEVGEETACRDLACQLVEVVVGVCGQVAYAALLLPNLYGEDGGDAASHAFVGGVEDLADDATAFGARVRSIIDGREHDLISTAAVDGVHVVDERFHGLMYAADSLVDGMLDDAFFAFEAFEGLVDIIIECSFVEVAVVGREELLEFLYLFDEGEADVGGEVEVECGYGLSAVHLVLCSLHADAGKHAGRLDALGGSALAVASHITAFEDVVEGMLHACQRLGGVVVLVVDVEVVVLDGFADVVAQEVVVDEGLGGFRGELHHHARRRVGIHISVFARDVVALDVDDFEEHLARLGLACDGALVAVLDVYLGHVLAGALHELQFNEVLYFFHGHLCLSTHADAVGYLMNEVLVFAFFSPKHGFTDGSNNLLFVEAYDASVALDYCLYHNYWGYVR